MLAASATSVFSAASPFAPKKQPDYDPVNRLNLHVRPVDESRITNESAPKGDYPEASLGVSFPSTSPGAILGNTYYDYQANSFQGRMTRAGRNFDVSTPSDSLPLIHFVWMNSNSATLGSGHRGPAYAYYDGAAGGYQPELQVTGGVERSGYFCMEVSKGNQAIIGGHYNVDGDVNFYDPQVWYDDGAGQQAFGYIAQVPDEIQHLGNSGAENIIWPHIAFQTRPTGQHITHIAALTPGVGGLHYFRKEGNSNNLALGQLSSCADPVVSGWDCPYVPDTIQATVAGIEASKQSGKVALFFPVNIPPAGSSCDTCSVNSGGSPNDMYYQVSTNYGVSWGPTKNITHSDTATAEWLPYYEFDGLWDSNDEFHVAWVAFNWGQRREGIGLGSRIYHWKESFGNTAPNGGGARIAMQQLERGIKCNGTPFNLNYGKINLAQCNNNLYISAVDLWDGHNGDPANPDCSKRGYDGAAGGSANGEIVIVISDDNGFTFDLPHNLTNSPTPRCDPGGLAGNCDADHWPSMIPRGFPTRANEDWSSVTSVFPRAVSYPDGDGVEWLHIQYVNDLDAGSAIQGQGQILNVPLKHFRVACVAPDQVPVPVYNITEITWPTYVKPGQQKDVPILIENIGNALTSMSVTPNQITGPEGWLSVNGFAPNIGEGALNKDTGNIHLDATSITQEKINEAGGTTILFGEVWFNHDGPSDIDTIPVTLIVTDTILLPNVDTISTGVVKLQVATNGQFGGGNTVGTGGNKTRVGLDFWGNPAECDTVDSIPGNTERYIFDGSYAVGGPGVGLAPGDPVGDTNMAVQIFNVGPRTRQSVYQTTPQSGPTTAGILQTWSSGRSVNSDTSLAFTMRWVAPQVTAQYGTLANKTWYADQQFVTRELKIWSIDGVGHDSLAIGDVIDWDVPGDSGGGVQNTGDSSGARRLMYQRGTEYNDVNDTLECQDNDARFGGVAFAFLRAYWNHDNNNGTAKQWTIRDSIGYGGFFDANAHTELSFTSPRLWANMKANQGYRKWTHPHPDSLRLDLHTVLTGAQLYDLAVGDTVVLYTVYASVLEDLAGPARIQQLAERGRNFATYFGCCVGTKGDLDGNGAEANILDLNFAVGKIFRGGLKPACQGEGDVNSDKSILDILDLNFLVSKIFRGGASPAACSVAL